MEFDVEKLIYLYIAICLALIVFNAVCIFWFEIINIRIGRASAGFEKYPGRRVLEKKLRSENNALALERTLDRLGKENAEEYLKYIEDLRAIFLRQISERRIGDPLYKAYIYYFSAKFGLFRGCGSERLTDVLVRDAQDGDLYIRENSLKLIYSTGDVRAVLDAFRGIDREHISHEEKLLHDGLLSFTGNREELWSRIWETFEEFSPKMQLVFLDYFRFATGKFCDRYLDIMKDPERDSELRYSCLRYFRRYPYAPALGAILDFARGSEGEIWEYAAIAANTLESYPGTESFDALCGMLSSPNWHIRTNAAKALVSQGYGYSDFDSILDGDDRFAREALQYRLDIKAAMIPGGAA